MKSSEEQGEKQQEENIERETPNQENTEPSTEIE
jgi:hypothetical protein